MSLGCVSTLEVGEQFDEPWIRRLVVDDEPGVDRKRPVRRLDRYGRHVATGHGLALEQGDVMPGAVERVGRGQPAHPGADDGDIHPTSPSETGSAVRPARASSVFCMPASASRPIFSKVPPRNGWASRRIPPNRMSAV